MNYIRTKNTGEDLLRAICGARLTSVQFVLDYLILGFDEKGALTTLVWPEVTRSGVTYTRGVSGYRDSLCDLIEQVVDVVDIADDDKISITLLDGSELTIALGRYSGLGERAIFTGPNAILFTW